MALTLAEAEKYSTDVLYSGVIDELIMASPVLQYLPFIDIVGNSLAYNRLASDAPIGHYAVGDTWEEGTHVVDQLTAILTIMGGDADVDNFLRETRSNVMDLEGTAVLMKSKALARTWDDDFINGDNATNPNQIDGIDKLVCDERVIYCDGEGAAGAELSLDAIDELLDLIRPGPPDLLVMNREARRKLKSLARAAGTNLEVREGKLGQQVLQYGDTPIAISDYITGSTCPGDGDTCFCIYAMSFGEDALCGIQSPGGLQVERIGPLETKDANRTRIKWYPGLVLFSCLKLAKLCGCLTEEAPL